MGPNAFEYSEKKGIPKPNKPYLILVVLLKPQSEVKIRRLLELELGASGFPDHSIKST